MTMNLSPAAVLAELPDWENATCTELAGGLTNKTWRVTAGNKTGVLKIDNDPRAAPFGSRSEEAVVQNRAAEAGLAASVILAREGIYFTEFVEGDVWSRHRLDNVDNLKLIAVALRRLHALPRTGRLFDAGAAAKYYAGRVAALEAKVVAECIEIINGTTPHSELCCCHNDLVAENLVSTPELKFLDWEYACDNDPLFDLATLVEHHELDDAQTTVLMEAYLGVNAKNWDGDLAGQRKVYLALLCLWMASRPDTDPAALHNVARRLNAAATSCS